MIVSRDPEAMAPPVPSGLRLLPHQQEGIRFAVNRLRTNRGAMFGDVMGLGKTIEAIGTANAIVPHRILVVCPASVLFTWRREIWTWQTLGLPVLLIQAGLDTTLNRALVGWGANGWYIINYDILRDYPEIKSGKPWDLLILDESHKLKNPRGDPHSARVRQPRYCSDPIREGVAVDRHTDDKLRPRLVYATALPRSGDVAIV